VCIYLKNHKCNRVKGDVYFKLEIASLCRTRLSCIYLIKNKECNVDYDSEPEARLRGFDSFQQMESAFNIANLLPDTKCDNHADQIPNHTDLCQDPK